MRAVLLALVLICGQMRAAEVARYLFENNANDSGPNGYNLTTNGTVNYQTSPVCEGTYSAGVYSAANSFTAPAGFNTAMAALSTFTIGVCVYANSLANNPTVLGTLRNGICDCGLQIRSDGQVRWGDLGGAGYISSPAGAITTGAFKYIEIVQDSVNPRSYLYVDGVLQRSDNGVRVLSNLIATIFGNGTGGQANPLNGYLDNAVFLNTAATPTSTPTPRPTALNNRSLYIDNQMYLDFTWIDRVVEILVYLILPTHLGAHTQDQRVEQQENVYNYNIWREKTGRVTPRPTVTPKRTSTPPAKTTVTPTMTMTSTPGPKLTATPTRGPKEAAEEVAR